MNEDYLWDRSGPPDAEIDGLERTLAPFRYRHHANRVSTRKRAVWRGAIAAAALLAIAGWQLRFEPAPFSNWRVAGSTATRIRAGQTLYTGAAQSLTLEDDAVGRIDLGPGSELHAAAASRLLFRRGTLHALIWAPPRQFVVDTPSARAIDLGCEYTITMDSSGQGLLRVSTGWVAFQFSRQERFIPAGAACITRPGRGPGIPYFEDAPEPFTRSLAVFEQGDSAALSSLLAAARPRDGLTLWHLLTSVPVPERGAVFDRFAALVALPDSVSRAAALRADPHTMDLCWNALELENTGWWRGWERPWEDRPASQ